MDNKKKGMLFGKINIIDLIIIILVICAGVFVANRFLGIGTPIAARTQTVLLTFFAEESPVYVSPNTKVGDAVTDSDKSQPLGKVSEIHTGESVSFGYDQDGKLRISSREGYESVYITVEVNGTITENGVVVGSILYLPGHSAVVCAGFGKYYMKVQTIEVVEQQ